MSSRARAVSSCWLLAVACSDPAFVSLGRNLQSVSSGPDAGSPLDGATSASSCSTQALAAAPDDPTTAGSDLSFGCQIDPPPAPPDEPYCPPLTGEIITLASSCEQRLPLRCPDAEGDFGRARRMLFDVVGRCTDLAYQITATFEDGCATAITVEAYEPPVSPSVRECVIARLAAERYDCGQSLPCATGGTFPLPTR